MALSFTNADGDLLTLTDHASLDVSEISICAWANGLDAGTQSYLYKQNSYQAIFSNAGRPKLIIFNTGYQELELAYDDRITDSGWHHLVLVWDDVTDQMRIYIDGVIKASASKTSGAIQVTANNVLIGQCDDDMEDVRIYNRVLNEDDIKTIYNSRGCDKITSGLVYRGLLLGPDGVAASGTITDLSPSGNNAAISGTPEYVAFGIRVA